MCDEDGYATGWQLMLAAQRFQHRMYVFMDQSLEGLGISFAQYRILELLNDTSDLHLSEIARRLRVTRQATRATVEKLRLASLVDVESEAHASYVTISDLGRRRLALFRAATHDLPEALEAEFPPGRIFGLVRTLRKAEDCLTSPRQPLWWLSD